MEITCCVCGSEQSLTKALEAEEERLEIEETLGVPVPPIGIVCKLCQSNRQSPHYR